MNVIGLGVQLTITVAVKQEVGFADHRDYLDHVDSAVGTKLLDRTLF